MSIRQQDIENAIYALDSYYSDRTSGDTLAIVDEEFSGSFYATAYRASSGDIVIAFRGTDDLFDPITGYATGFGYATSL